MPFGKRFPSIRAVFLQSFLFNKTFFCTCPLLHNFPSYSRLLGKSFSFKLLCAYFSCYAVIFHRFRLHFAFLQFLFLLHSLWSSVLLCLRISVFKISVGSAYLAYFHPLLDPLCDFFPFVLLCIFTVHMHSLHPWFLMYFILHCGLLIKLSLHCGSFDMFSSHFMTFFAPFILCAFFVHIFPSLRCPFSSFLLSSRILSLHKAFFV